MPEARYCIDCGKQCNGNRCRCCYISHHRVQPALPVTCLVLQELCKKTQPVKTQKAVQKARHAFQPACSQYGSF